MDQKSQCSVIQDENFEAVFKIDSSINLNEHVGRRRPSNDKKNQHQHQKQGSQANQLNLKTAVCTDRSFSNNQGGLSSKAKRTTGSACSEYRLKAAKKTTSTLNHSKSNKLMTNLRSAFQTIAPQFSQQNTPPNKSKLIEYQDFQNLNWMSGEKSMTQDWGFSLPTATAVQGIPSQQQYNNDFSQVLNAMGQMEMKIKDLEMQIQFHNQVINNEINFQKETKTKFSEIDMRLLRLDIIQKITQSYLKNQTGQIISKLHHHGTNNNEIQNQQSHQDQKGNDSKDLSTEFDDIPDCQEHLNDSSKQFVYQSNFKHESVTTDDRTSRFDPLRSSMNLPKFNIDQNSSNLNSPLLKTAKSATLADKVLQIPVSYQQSTAQRLEKSKDKKPPIQQPQIKTMTKTKSASKIGSCFAYTKDYQLFKNKKQSQPNVTSANKPVFQQPRKSHNAIIQQKNTEQTVRSDINDQSQLPLQVKLPSHQSPNNSHLNQIVNEQRNSQSPQSRVMSKQVQQEDIHAKILEQDETNQQIMSIYNEAMMENMLNRDSEVSIDSSYFNKQKSYNDNSHMILPSLHNLEISIQEEHLCDLYNTNSTKQSRQYPASRSAFEDNKNMPLQRSTQQQSTIVYKNFPPNIENYSPSPAEKTTLQQKFNIQTSKMKILPLQPIEDISCIPPKDSISILDNNLKKSAIMNIMNLDKNDTQQRQFIIQSQWFNEFCKENSINLESFKNPTIISNQMAISATINEGFDPSVRKSLEPLQSQNQAQSHNWETLNTLFKNIWIDSQFFINNSQLLDQQGELKKDLTANKDYCVVNEKIWNLIKQWGYEYDIEIRLLQ